VVIVEPTTLAGFAGFHRSNPCYPSPSDTVVVSLFLSILHFDLSKAPDETPYILLLLQLLRLKRNEEVSRSPNVEDPFQTLNRQIKS